MNQTLSQRTVTCLYVAVFKLILVQFSYESVARVFLHGVYLSVIFGHLAVISGWLKWTVFGWSSPPLDPELQPPTGRWDFTYLLTYLFSSNKLYVCRRFSSHFNSCSSVAVFSPFVDDQSMRHFCYCCRKTRLECASAVLLFVFLCLSTTETADWKQSVSELVVLCWFAVLRHIAGSVLFAV